MDGEGEGEEAMCATASDELSVLAVRLCTCVEERCLVASCLSHASCHVPTPWEVRSRQAYRRDGCASPHCHRRVGGRRRGTSPKHFIFRIGVRDERAVSSIDREAAGNPANGSPSRASAPASKGMPCNEQMDARARPRKSPPLCIRCFSSSSHTHHDDSTAVERVP